MAQTMGAYLAAVAAPRLLVGLSVLLAVTALALLGLWLLWLSPYGVGISAA